jgi:putative inorganic carbon (HCO3(-)) transporter
LSLALIACYKPFWVRALLLGIVGLGGYVFFLANSRGASFALISVLLVMWITSKRKIKGTLIGIVLLGAFALLAPDSYWERLQTVNHYQEDASSTDRVELWGIAMNLIPQHPILGVGFMNFTRYAYNTPHEAYLQIASEVGLPAVFVYIALLISGIYAAANARWLSAPDRQDNPNVYAASQGILCCVVAVAVQGLTTGLAHREIVHVFICLAYSAQAVAKQLPSATGRKSDGLHEHDLPVPSESLQAASRMPAADSIT